MTSMYERMRQEVVVGGGAQEETNKPSTSRAVLSAIVIGGLLVWLGLKNVWTLVFVVGFWYQFSCMKLAISSLLAAQE